jgi:hypothetical protein
MSILNATAKRASVRGFYPYNIEGSLRFNDDDSAYLSWTPESAGNRKTWTWSGWVKRGNIGFSQILFQQRADSDGSQQVRIMFQTDSIQIIDQSGGATQGLYQTTAVYRDPSAWYHIVVSCDTTNATESDRVKLYVNGERVTSFSTTDHWPLNYDTSVNNTVRALIGVQRPNTGSTLNSYLDAYLAEVHFTDGTAYDADAFGEFKNGVWVAKEADVTYGTNGFYLTFQDDTEVEAFNTVLYEGEGAVQQVTGVGFSPDLVWVKTRTDTNNHNLFDTVRGPNRRLFSNLTNAENTTANTFQSFDPDGFTTGVIADVNDNNEDHVAWCWDAGENNAVTGHSSVTYTGNGGTQKISGFPFSPDLVWIKSRSGSNSHFLTDTVRGARETLFTNTTAAEVTESQGLISFSYNDFIVGNDASVNSSGGSYVAWGWDAGDDDPVSNTDGSITSTVKASQANGFSIVAYTGDGSSSADVGHGLTSVDFMILKERTDGVGSSSYWRVTDRATASQGFLQLTNAFTAIGDGGGNGSIDPATLSSTTFGFKGSSTVNNVNASSANYIAYCFQNVMGKQKFGSYTGDGGTSNSVTTGFRPGFVMIKRTDGAANWEIYDSSRESFTTSGQLYPNTSDVEGGNHIQFDSNGFTLTADRTNTNENTATYIYAAFAGSYSDYITDYNTDGSIDSRVKANDTTGFSIVSFTADSGTNKFTVGHGLSSTPDLVIVKSRTNGAAPWYVYHTSLATNNYLRLNATNATNSDTEQWGDGMTSSVLGLRAGYSTVASTDTIAYCWAEKSGYSKFGSYTGDGSTDGSLEITVGFPISMLMIKRTDSTGNWNILDNTRDATGYLDSRLYPNLSNAEDSDTNADFELTATSFKLRNNKGELNASGGTYIYAAFADTREAAFWLDQSGNDNDWQPVNLDHNDTLLDSPTDNFATLNPLDYTTGTGTLSDGNLKASALAGVARGTIAFPSTGQSYFEVLVGGTGNVGIGISPASSSISAANGSSGFYGLLMNGSLYTAGSATSNWSVTYTDGDYIGVSVDGDTGYVKFYKNGVDLRPDLSTAYAGLDFSEHWLPLVRPYDAGTSCTINFGQQPWAYGPPE